VSEGDDVHRLAGRMDARLRGEPLRRSDFRVPRYAAADLTGQRVARVRARGKNLLLETDAGTTVHSHLKMEGAWHLYAPGERWRHAAHLARVVLETPSYVAVGFRLGLVEIWPTAAEAEHLGHLGPDVLGPDWDAAEAERRLVADPGREVGAALIDQRVMAGPGNVYKSEALFLRGLHPSVPVGAVADPKALVTIVKRLMEANREGPRVTTGDTRTGRRYWVYGRAGEPCRRCGTVVRRLSQGEAPRERSTYFCPSCQARPRPAPGV
jgi:endonuclease VIII